MPWLDGRDASGQPLVPPTAEGGTDVSGFVLLGTASATGEQHYVAEWSEDEQAWVWALVGPTAVLTDPVSSQMVASHAGGRDYGGPIWTSNDDGSSVQGELAPGFVPERYSDRIAPLKLITNRAYSGGIMGAVEAIQRIETQGGHPGPPPDAESDAGRQKSVPYTATYVFWGDRLPE